MTANNKQEKLTDIKKNIIKQCHLISNDNRRGEIENHTQLL